MPAAAIKVVPPLSPRGLYLLFIILGSGLGLVTHDFENWAFRLSNSDFIRHHLTPFQADLVDPLAGAAVIFFPAFLIGLWLSFLSQRRGQIALAAAISGATQILVSLFAGQVLWSVHGGVDWSGWPLFSFLVNVAIIAGMSALCALLVRWLVRLRFTIVEQDGTRCSRCGYQLGSPAITTCPECGVPADTARLSFAGLHRISTWLQRRWPLLGAVLIVFLMIQLPVPI